MELTQRAMIVAFARLCGVTGTDKEIFDKYWQYYQNALKSLPDTEQQNSTTVVKRPF